MAVREPLPASDGRLVENIVHFTRALRKAGVRVGTAQVEAAIRAVEAAGFTHRTDFYHILRATMVNRAEDLEVFHQVFVMFWRDPEYLEHLIHMMSPTVRREDEERKKKAAERRAAEALTPERKPPEAPKERTEIELDAQFSWSEVERLRAMDFEQMSAAEARAAARAIRGLRLPVPPLRTRRLSSSSRGRAPDVRATLRDSLRRGGEIGALRRRAPRERPMDLVVLCDISGSMTAYSRMMMHFLHALVWAPERAWGHVSGFTFGTRLTNVTRALHKRDVDAALDAVGREALDWKGGTQIGEALARFNRDWSRRLLGQGACVLLVSDGLEREDSALLAEEAERLRLSCRRLVWLNPLLRWEDFAPRAAGIRALLQHVDALFACHNLDSLEALARAFDKAGDLERLRARM